MHYLFKPSIRGFSTSIVPEQTSYTRIVIYNYQNEPELYEINDRIINPSNFMKNDQSPAKNVPNNWRNLRLKQQRKPHQLKRAGCD